MYDILIVGGRPAGLTAAVYARRGAALPEERAADPWAERGYAVTEEELRRRLAQ